MLKYISEVNMKNIKKILILLILLIPFNVFALSDNDININSRNAVVINLNNNEIIYEKNKDEVINVASMQKIMTAILRFKIQIEAV
jgi:D-alanyl-D-alanine carboxypeptidase